MQSVSLIQNLLTFPYNVVKSHTFMYITHLISFLIYCNDSLLVKIYAFKFAFYSDNFLTCHKIFIYIFYIKYCLIGQITITDYMVALNC